MTTTDNDTSDKIEVDVPVGNYCWACAVALECWGEDKDASCARYHVEVVFRASVDTSRKAVVLAKASLLIERIKAIKNTTFATKVIRKYWFLFAVVFSKHFRIPLDVASQFCMQLLTTDNEYMTGVLVRGPIPKELEWQCDEVHIEISQARFLDQELAGPETVFRSGQASDRFRASVAKVVQGRGKSFKAVTYEQLQKQVELEERQRLQAEAEHANLQSGGAGSTAHIATSMLGGEDEGDEMFQGPAKGGGRGGRAAAARGVAKATATGKPPPVKKSPGRCESESPVWCETQSSKCAFAAGAWCNWWICCSRNASPLSGTRNAILDCSDGCSRNARLS